jgi:hypothetical protein
MLRVAVLGATMLVGGCFHNDRGELVSNTTTTGYTTAGTVSPRPQRTGCTSDLHSYVQFDHESSAVSAQQRGELVHWATCLNRPEMRDQTVVLTGGIDPDDRHPVFATRAAAIKNELATYGVDASRVVIGEANAVRDGGKLGPSDAVKIELAHASHLRTMR